MGKPRARMPAFIPNSANSSCVTLGKALNSLYTLQFPPLESEHDPTTYLAGCARIKGVDICRELRPEPGTQ